ncbi:MAG: CBS domain-containing protein [Candidatus Micrarchaeota archaeon]|nr:CBS domain-containing protein [Candidatus Micrarchaeota archaeon]
MELFDSIEEAFTVDYEEPLTKAISELPRHKTCLVVLKNKKYVGIVDDWTITSSAVEHTSKVGSIAICAPTITRNTSVLNICRLFFSGPYRALPVIEEDKIIGILPRNEALKLIVDEGLLEKGKVEELMFKPVPRIDLKSHLGRAKSKMRGNQYGKLAVVDEGKLVGVLTAYDFAAFLSKPRDKLPLGRSKTRLENIPVSSLMREDVHTIKPDASLKESAMEMIKNDVAALIVESGQKPVGIISARNLFKGVAGPDETALDISGLAEGDRMFVEDIREECMNFLSKLKKSFDVEHMYLHFKKHRKKYSVHGKLNAGRVSYSASSFGWDLRSALKSFLDEMDAIFREEKDARTHMKKNRPQKSERWIE